MKKMFIVLIVIACVIVYFVVLFSTRKVCFQDSDCDYISVGCCSCWNGKESFNRHYVSFAENLASFLDTRSCATMLCAMCFTPMVEPACIDNRCSVREIEQEGLLTE